MRYLVREWLRQLSELALLPFLILAAYRARWYSRPVQVGLGPEPLLNNVTHKKALLQAGLSAETFVTHTNFITREFDHDFSRAGWLPCFLFVLRRYRCLFLYFNGGPLLHTTRLWRWEGLLFKLARINVVMLHYGGDIQEMSRCRNPAYKHALSQDYPGHRFRRQRIADQIDLWTRWADHIVAGCDAIEYLYHWDTLVPWHLSVDERLWECPAVPTHGPLRVLHAPNHRAIKGTALVLEAVERLRQRGLPIELILLERVPNEDVRQKMAEADVVVDQLVIGWYGLFALEAMAAGRAVLGYINPDWRAFYAPVLRSELPIQSCRTAQELEACLEGLTRDRVRELGQAGREYVRQHHSLEVVGQLFAGILRGLDRP